MIDEIATALDLSADHPVVMAIAEHNLSPDSKGPVQLVDDIVAWEDGELDVFRQWLLFGRLIGNGYVWSLQGMYGRTAQYLLDDGILDVHGCVNPHHPLVLAYAHQEVV